MKCYVYILRSKSDGKRYIGVAFDIEARLTSHNAGRVPSTKKRRPLELIYSEKYASRVDALKRELFFKSGAGREFLREHGIR